MDRQPHGEALRILLVEDNENDRLIFRRAFQKSNLNAEITECSRAEEALTRLRAPGAAFDLVVVDHDLPGMSGLNLCRVLVEESASMPLVVLTGRGTEQLAKDALKMGVADYMAKDSGNTYLNLLPVVLPEVVSRHKDRIARQQVETLLKENQKHLSQIVQGSSVPIYVLNDRHIITHWNRACEKLTGITAQQMIGTDKAWYPFYPTKRPVMANLIIEGASMETFAAHYPGKCRASELIEGAYEAEDFFPSLGPNGHWLFFTAAPLRDPEGSVIGSIVTFQDLTLRKQAEAGLQENQERLLQIIQGSSVPIYVLNDRHIITHWNRACEKLTGITAREMIGTDKAWYPFYTEKRPVMADLIVDGAPEKVFDAHYSGKYRKSNLIEGAYEAEDFFPTLGTQGRWLFFSAAPLRDSAHHVMGAIVTFQDFSQRKEAEEKLIESERKYKELSIVDELTQLYNARHFYKSLKYEVTRADRYQHPLSLLLIDIDDFKRYNDIYGHLAGDSVLARMGNILCANLRTNDSAYRYGGEEFTIILPESRADAALLVAERIRCAFEAVTHCPDSKTKERMTVSVGGAQYRTGEEVSAFIKRADSCMYKAKSQGKNRSVFTEAAQR